MSTTVAACHGVGPDGAAGADAPADIAEDRGSGSVTLVALLQPWIAAVVVPVLLPEAWLVVRQQLEARHPLGALPEVQVRHQETGGAAVIHRQGRSVVLP